MKKSVILFVVLASLVCDCFAQNSYVSADDYGRIALSAYISEDSSIPSRNRAMMLNKLNQISSKNGMAASAGHRFILTANVQVEGKEITPTAPPMHAVVLSVTIYVGDGVDGKLYASGGQTVKGVGESEVKAYAAALKKINVNDPEFATVVSTGKQRILEYYNSQCDFIIADADADASKGDYDGAMAGLGAVPDVCKDCYVRCAEKIAMYYQMKIDADGKSLLLKAQSVWSADQTIAGADAAASYLSDISPNSSAYADAMRLTARIAETVKANQDREWEYAKKQQENEHAQTLASIEAAKAAVVALASRPVTYKFSWF